MALDLALIPAAALAAVHDPVEDAQAVASAAVHDPVEDAQAVASVAVRDPVEDALAVASVEVRGRAAAEAPVVALAAEAMVAVIDK